VEGDKVKIGSVDWRAALIASAFVLPIFFVAPLRVFAHNTADFSVGLSDVVVGLLLVCLPLLGVVYVAGRVWPRVVLPAVVALSVVAFLESTLFLSLAQHRPFDGQPIDWSQWHGLSVIEVAAAIAVGFFVAAWHQREQVWYSASVFILLFQALSLGSTLFLRREVIEAHRVRQAYSYFGGFHRLSSRRNVIHVVPDTTQGAMVQDLFQSDPARYSKIFDGFTLFSQAMGRYPGTYPSVSFYMTGRSLDPNRDYTVSQPFRWDYIRKTLRDQSIVTTLAYNGFRTFGFQCCSLYCVGAYSACAVGDVFDGRPLERDGATAAVRRLLDVAFFQTTPLVVRRYIYNDGDWFLKAARRKDRTYSAIMDAFLAGMTIDGRAASYNYFHLAGGHGPLQFDQNCNYIGIQEITYQNQRRQVACAMLQVERLIGALKRLGVYDQTMIVINGDHGTPALPSSVASGTAGPISDFLMGTASALVLVKPMHARGPLAFSSAQATIGDIPATVSDAFGLNGRFPGQSLFRLDGTDRDREYFMYDEGERVSGLQALPNLRRYRVRGNIFDQRSWIRPVLSAAGATPSTLWMDDEHFDQHATGFGSLEAQAKPARWVTGTRARVSLSFPTSGRARLVLESYVPPSIPGQSLVVSINGGVIARLDDKALTERRHVIPVPADLPRRKVNAIELTMGKAIKVQGDARALSIVFAYIGLEPVR
jgi:Sulfatase